MRKTLGALILLTMALLTVPHLLADEEAHVLKLALDDADFEIEDLEVGETRQLFTSSGEEVLITRNEDGYHLEVGDRQLDISKDQGSVFITSGDSSRVVVHKHGEGEDHHGYHMFVGHGEGDHPSMQIDIGGSGVAERLLASGVLDSLDEETRQQILDELGKISAHKNIEIHKIVLDEENEEDS